jgi:hypothetical protein
MTFKEWLVDLLKDERGATSIKPLIALMGSTFLCATMLIDSLNSELLKPSDVIVNAVMIITGIGMGADTLDKFSYKSPTNTNNQPQQPTDPNNQPQQTYYSKSGQQPVEQI